MLTPGNKRGSGVLAPGTDGLMAALAAIHIVHDLNDAMARTVQVRVVGGGIHHFPNFLEPIFVLKIGNINRFHYLSRVSGRL